MYKSFVVCLEKFYKSSTFGLYPSGRARGYKMSLMKAVLIKTKNSSQNTIMARVFKYNQLKHLLALTKGEDKDIIWIAFTSSWKERWANAF
jgi:hypothetical protein